LHNCAGQDTEEEEEEEEEEAGEIDRGK